MNIFSGNRTGGCILFPEKIFKIGIFKNIGYRARTTKVGSADMKKKTKNFLSKNSVLLIKKLS